jgi:uncharacterized protein (DUF983 family)
MTEPKSVPCTRCGKGKALDAGSLDIDPVCAWCARAIAAADEEVASARMELAIARFDRTWGPILRKD